MSNTNKIQLEFDVQDSFVDLSKPYDYRSLYYEVVADKTVVPEKENTLYLPIKGVYFNAIMSREKTEEYREVRETTYVKYLQTNKQKDFYVRKDFPNVDFGLYDYNNGFYPFLPKPYKYLKIAVGYEKERDWAIVEVVGISFQPAMNENGDVFRFDIDEVNNTEYETPDGKYTDWIIVYHLGKVVEYHPKGVETERAPSKVNEPAVKYERKPRPRIADSIDRDVHSPENKQTGMSVHPRNFDFLKNNPDFADLYTLCNEAEICQLSDPSKSALSCRRALEYTTKAIYLLKGFHIPERASLF